MGIFSRRIKDPVQGTLHVVSTSTPPSGGLSVWMVMDFVISVPGHESYPDRGRFFVDLGKFPHPGSILPIEASASDPKRYKILWDQVATTTDVAFDQARRLADSLNAAAAEATPPGPGNDPGSSATSAPPPPGTPPPGSPGGATVITGDAAAEMIRTFIGDAASGATPGVHVQRSVTVNGRPAEPGELAAFETLTGMDLDGDGIVGPGPDRSP